MLLGPIFWRELVIGSKRRGTFGDRTSGPTLVLVLFLAQVWLWDYLDLDVTTLQGIRAFLVSVFIMILSVHAVVMALTPNDVAAMLAGERDRKSLDALLATRLTSAEVVLGAMAGGMYRVLGRLGAMVPLMILMVWLGGVDPALIVLFYIGLGATAFFMASVAIACSVFERTTRRAVSLAVGLVWGWMFLPLVGTGVLPRIWPAVGRWVYPVALALQESSPMGVMASNLITAVRGVFPRGTLVEDTRWMVACELIAGALILVVAIARLRAASRALYDLENRSLLLRMLRVRKRRPRPPCGDDPVLWHQKYATREVNAILYYLGMFINLVFLIAMCVAALAFAWPAFSEVLSLGYSPTSADASHQRIFPYGRLAPIFGFRYTPPSGLARLEFNMVLRHFTEAFYFLYVLVIAGAAAEGIPVERERDTWLGLIATPLSGREILNGKMLGALWRMRHGIGLIVAVWLVGLVAGAIHPVGFILALAGLGVASWFLLAFGTYLSLWSRTRATATNRVIMPVLLMLLSGLTLLAPPRYATVFTSLVSMPFIGGLSLFSYDDVLVISSRAGQAFPGLLAVGIETGESARRVIAMCVLALTTQAIAAYLLTRTAYRQFDAAAGRPTRSRDPGLTRR